MAVILKIVVVILLGVVYFLLKIEAKKGGNTATKVGLAGITQVSASSSANSEPSFSQSKANSETYDDNTTIVSDVKRLKDFLFRGYDKQIRPVKNSSDSVLVMLDITYMQVLNLNEKDQILKSLLRYRLYWKDQFLSWEPKDHSGIKKIWLSATSIWMPDIICMEEIGARDYVPKVPFVFVSHDGLVTYLEPTAYETTCQVRIANFPFDIQTCNFSFGSWTVPISKLDIVSKRSEADMATDIPKYFSDTGEWKLEYINVSKTTESYLSLFESGNDGRNLTKEEIDFMVNRFHSSDPLRSVQEVAPLRVTDAHWSEVQFRLTFRRSSSLYIQSMLFPAILLTTISLLGFYLPPDSGERIGLQITILLTFMVFILTVGDMFPASTGPYLGVYFVLCMALLGINIIMTVLVLYLHHIPSSIVMEVEPVTNICRTNMKVLPLWIKLALKCSRLYDVLYNYTIPEDAPTEKSRCQEKQSFFRFLWTKWKNSSNLRKTTERKNISPIQNVSQQTESPTLFNGKRDRVPSRHGHDCVPNYRNQLGKGGGLRQRQTQKEDATTFLEVCVINELNMKDSISGGQQRASQNEVSSAANGPDLTIDNVSRHQGIAHDLSNISNDVSKMSCCTTWHIDEMKSKQLEDIMQEKWRSVARKIDVVCMFSYLGCVIIFHAGIGLAVLLGI